MVRSEYLPAREAAELLGVSLNTFYVYVGRHEIRSQPIAGSRERLYWRQDLMRLSKRRKARGKARDASAITSPRRTVTRESGLTLRTEDGLFYRGESAIELARTASLERVAAILWDCKEEEAFGRDLPAKPDDAGMLRSLQHLSQLDRAAFLLPMLEAANPRSFDLSAAGLVRTGGGVVRWLATSLLDADMPTEEPIHIYMAHKLKLNDLDADLARRLMVLSADHGFERAAIAVRAVAANGVTLWRSVMTGLLVMTGRRSSLGRYEAVQRLLGEILDGPDASAPILRRLRDGDPVPGFDPGVSRSEDPRVAAMLAILTETMSDNPSYRRLSQAIDLVRDTTSAQPTFSLVSLFVNRNLGLDYQWPLFPLARAVGWIAHAIEQQRGDSEHLEGVYSGPLPRVDTGIL